MDDRSNIIAGWVLGAGIVALGSSIVFGKMFHGEVPHKAGYEIVSEEGTGGGAAEVPLATLLASADAAKGEATFAKCKSCHTIAAGGAAGLGPNLNAVLGKGIAAGSFAYSDALKGVGGNWDFEKLNAWLTNPKKFASGNKMAFAGLPKGEDRANILLYINSMGSNLPLPAAPAPGEVAAEGADAAKAAEAAPAADAAKAGDAAK
jgi:cytochrome c